LKEKYELLYPLLYPNEQIKVLEDKIIPNVLPEFYFISSLGRVFSFYKNKPHIVKISNDVYQSVYITLQNKSGTRRSIYRLVKMVFDPIVDCTKQIVFHIDGNKNDNTLNNLYYPNDSRYPFIWFIELYQNGYLDPDEIILPITELHVKNILPYYFITNKGKIISIYGHAHNEPYVMARKLNANGYPYIHLRLKNGYFQPRMIHRLMMIVFRYRPDYKLLVVNHKYNDPTNNFIDPNGILDNDSIEWCTLKYNSMFMVRSGRASNQTFTENEVMEIKEMISDGANLEDIASIYKVKVDIIRNIKNNKNYSAFDDELFNKEIEKINNQLGIYPS
jgi:hypothetical protein